MNKNQYGGCLLRVIALFMAFATQAPAKDLEWFEGGTLQNTTISAWKNATPRNRLATCGDWIAGAWNHGNSTKQYKSMNEIRADAEQLQIRIDLAVALAVVKDNDGTAETATTLLIMMKLVK